MCGRVTLHDVDQMRDFLRSYFSIEQHEFPGLPRYNIAPKQQVWSIIYHANTFRVGQMPWGMMIQSKDKAFFNINAKRETIQSFYTFKRLYQNQRALLIMNGYYEWQDQEDFKQPYYITDDNHHIMIVAALWDKQQDGFGLTLMTQKPYESLESIHHRMPVLLSPEEGIEYLKFGTLPNRSTIGVTYHPVSHEVNQVKKDHEGLILNVDQMYESFLD
jgi:putative SOS response-associated peptidase YedK